MRARVVTLLLQIARGLAALAPWALVAIIVTPRQRWWLLAAFVLYVALLWWVC